MSLYDIPVHTLAGEPTTLAEHKGKALLVVNVASKCGLTPQYTGLEQLQDGFRPVVFCRFIATADYLAAQLPKLLRSFDGLEVRAVLTKADLDAVRG